MDNQRKGVVSGALHVAGETVKLGLGLGVLGISKLGSLVRGVISNGNEAVKSASTTVGDGISDAKQATGHVAEAAEALIVEFGHTFQSQAGAPADVKAEPAAAKTEGAAQTSKPKSARKAAAKKSPAAKTAAAKPATGKAASSPEKAKTAAKAKAPVKTKAPATAKVETKAEEAEKPAETASIAEGSGSTPATVAAAPKPVAIRKSAPKKPGTKTTVKKPKSAAPGPELAQLVEPTPPASKLH
jgi:hypothetical protein